MMTTPDDRMSLAMRVFSGIGGADREKPWVHLLVADACIVYRVDEKRIGTPRRPMVRGVGFFTHLVPVGDGW